MAEPVPAPVVGLEAISKAFPGVRALDRVSLQVLPGQVHALVGKNGAGKSTLMHILTGIHPPDSGTIRIRGKTFERLSTAQAKEAGIALVSQHARFVPGLTIAENVFLGDMPVRQLGFVDWPRVFGGAAERLRRFGLDIDVRRRMETASVAERQMIEIARALFAGASVVILDEPTAPLPKHEVAVLFDFVRRQRAQGAAFIYISHYLEEVFEVADQATVLRDGRVVGTSPVASLTQGELVRRISGTNVERFARSTGRVGKPVLEVAGLTRRGAYTNVSLTFHAGEVIGMTGLEGSGPAALGRGLFGLEPLGAGRVMLDGRPYAAQSPGEALRQGLAYLPRDRHGLGIVGVRSVRDNVSLAILDRLDGRLGMIDAAAERALVRDYVATLGIKTSSIMTAVETLSGGNQQKVVVAKLAATRPRVLLLDEPTQGVDVEAKVEILKIVDKLAQEGVAVAVISDELGELMDICDRILVFHRGRIVREFRKGRDDISGELLLAAIEGGAMEAVHGVA
jgi:ABC-type sugar transport system ATPase subunit